MNGVRDISMKALTDPLPGKSVVPFHFAARSAARPCGNGVALSIEQWTSEVRTVWEQGGTNTLELARVVCAARRGLRYGQWSQLWKSGKMPFSRRKGAMLVVIGQRLGGIDAQTFAHLPRGWSILYHLAQLDRIVLETLAAKGTVHPRLTLAASKELVAKFKCQATPVRWRRTPVRERLRRFEAFVRATLSDWSREDRRFATEELTRIIDQIGAAAGVGIKRNGIGEIYRARGIEPSMIEL